MWMTLFITVNLVTFCKTGISVFSLMDRHQFCTHSPGSNLGNKVLDRSCHDSDLMQHQDVGLCKLKKNALACLHADAQNLGW